jgi:hypothetical protein
VHYNITGINYNNLTDTIQLEGKGNVLIQSFFEKDTRFSEEFSLTFKIEIQQNGNKWALVESDDTLIDLINMEFKNAQIEPI